MKSISVCSLYLYDEDSLRVFVNERTHDIAFAEDDVANILWHGCVREMTKYLDDTERIKVTCKSGTENQYLYHEVKAITFLGLAHAVLNRMMKPVNSVQAAQNADEFFSWVTHRVVPKELAGELSV